VRLIALLAATGFTRQSVGKVEAGLLDCAIEVTYGS